jgi:hypothetical protein
MRLLCLCLTLAAVAVGMPPSLAGEKKPDGKPLFNGKDLAGWKLRGGDKAYDVAQFVHDLRRRSITPHIAIDGHITKTGKRRRTAVDRRITRHAGYEISQRCRKRIEEVFGWIKGSAGLAKVKLRGRARVDAAFTLALAAYNLVRLPKLLAAPT